MGPLMQKILLLLEGGVILGFTRRPAAYFRIVKKISKEWQNINRKTLERSIRRLYQSQLVDFRDNKDGTASLVLTDKGKKRTLRHDIDNLKIKKPTHWDHLWRLVIFDIPEDNKKERDALVAKLKQLGFYPMQKCVFIYPYECKDEIDFIIEVFNLRPYVRMFIVKETDIELDLRNRFKL